MTDKPNLHDAELYAVRHDADLRKVECMLRSPDGRNGVITLLGVTAFRCTDFCLQNVILELICTAWQVIDPVELRASLIWIHTNAEGGTVVAPEEINATLSEILLGRLHCLLLIPSWGVKLAATASHVELQWD